MHLWWPRSERLEWELRALADAGCEYEIIRGDIASSEELHVRVSYPYNDGVTPLDVYFPVFYPFFRFQIHAPELRLEHHQNPFEHNLCLLGRSTDQWRLTDSLAAFLQHQVPLVLNAGASVDADEVAPIEQHQAEPLSTYYPYATDSLVGVDGSWRSTAAVNEGSLVFGHPSANDTQGFHAFVLEIKDNDGNVLDRCDERIARLCKPIKNTGRWIRVTSPILEHDPEQFFHLAANQDPQITTQRWQSSPYKSFRLVAVIFPEEHAWRDGNSGDGWVFVIQLRHSGTQRKEQGRYTFHFIRAGRTGVEDYLQRVPETRFLQEKRITLVGLGCLGAPIAMELAQAGIGHLHLVDHDFVDPPSTVRWPMGTPAFGVYKVDALRRYICQHFPYTTVSGDVWQIGSVQRQSGAEQLRMADHLLEGTSLIIDASAEHGVQRFLSEFARHHGIPYVWVWGTRGSWGGVVGRVFPDRGACWACIESADRRGELPQAPEDATGELQPAGCGDPTFTGAGFDMHFLSISAVRLAVATLTDPHHGYPSQDCNVQVVTLRSAAGELVSPRWESFTIPRSDRCEFCGSG